MRKIAIAVAAALAFGLTGCGSDKPSPVVSISPNPVVSVDAKREAEFQLYECLYAAMSAYPNVPENQMALDFVDACKPVPEPDKADLRAMVNAFIAEAHRRAAQ